MKIIFKQLPDIHSQHDLERQELRAYGRFGVLPDGSLWLGDPRSSHPRELLVGWYWAISNDEELIVSSRNVGSEAELLQGEGNIIIKHLLHELISRRIITRQQGEAYGL